MVLDLRLYCLILLIPSLWDETVAGTVDFCFSSYFSSLPPLFTLNTTYLYTKCGIIHNYQKTQHIAGLPDHIKRKKQHPQNASYFSLTYHTLDWFQTNWANDH